MLLVFLQQNFFIQIEIHQLQLKYFIPWRFDFHRKSSSEERKHHFFIQFLAQ